MPLSVTTADVVGHVVEQVQGGVETGREGREIPVVDADDARIERQGLVQLRPVMHFDQHIEADVPRQPVEVGELGGLQCRDDQQQAVGAKRTRLVDLVLVDDEILAQNR